MDALKRSLLGGLEGVVPSKGEGIDMEAVGRDGEAGLDECESAEVGQEKVAAGLRRGVGGFLNAGAHLPDGVEVILRHLSFAL